MATQKPSNEKGLISHGLSELGKQGTPSQEPGLGAFRKVRLQQSRWQELGMVCGTHDGVQGRRGLDPQLKHPGCWVLPPPALGCTPGWQGWGTALLEAEHPMPCPSLPSLALGDRYQGGRHLLTCLEPVLPLCYPYLEQQPGTNSPRFTKPLRKAIRQINERKAPIKDYQTPSLPGERPGAIHF